MLMKLLDRIKSFFYLFINYVIVFIYKSVNHAHENQNPFLRIQYRPQVKRVHSATLVMEVKSVSENIIISTK